MTTTSQAEAVPSIAPVRSSGADLEGVIAYVETQLRQLSDLCAEPASAERRPPGLTLEELRQKRDALSRAARTLAEREKQLQDWHDKLESTQSRLATEHETVTGTLEQRRTELNSLDGSLRSRSAEVASRRESLAAREASLTAAEGELAERERRFAAARHALDRRASELDAASASIEGRAARLAERVESVRLAESQADSRAAAITEHESTLDARHDAAERDSRIAEVATLRATVASLRSRLEEAGRASDVAPGPGPGLSEELDRLSRQRDSLARELSDRERLVEELSSDCLVLRADADAALTRAAEQDRQIRRLEGRVGELSAELAGASGGLESQRSLLRAARSESASAKHQLEAFRAELDLRHEELTERSHELDLREAELERREVAIENASTLPAARAAIRPDMPGVTAVPSGGLTVPDVWFAWAAPRRRRPGTGGSVDPFPRR